MDRHRVRAAGSTSRALRTRLDLGAELTDASASADRDGPVAELLAATFATLDVETALTRLEAAGAPAAPAEARGHLRGSVLRRERPLRDVRRRRVRTCHWLCPPRSLRPDRERLGRWRTAARLRHRAHPARAPDSRRHALLAGLLPKRDRGPRPPPRRPRSGCVTREVAVRHMRGNGLPWLGVGFPDQRGR